MRSGLRKILTLLFIVVPMALIAQEKSGDSKQDKHEKEAARRKAEQQQMQEEAIERGRKHQMQIQSKETRKRMKRNAKKARRVNEGRDEFFLFKLFHKKRK
jgi:hypothetical protein